MEKFLAQAAKHAKEKVRPKSFLPQSADSQVQMNPVQNLMNDLLEGHLLPSNQMLTIKLTINPLGLSSLQHIFMVFNFALFQALLSHMFRELLSCCISSIEAIGS